MITENCLDVQSIAALHGVSLPEKVRLVADSSASYRQQVIDILLMAGSKVDLPLLAEAMRKERDAALRNGEMELLIAFGDVTIPHLTRLLTDDNHEVRSFSAVMLGNIGNPQAVMPLIAALQDPEADVRRGAAEALGKIGDYRAVLPLQTMANGDVWDQIYAAAALGLLAGAGEDRAAAAEAP